MTLNKKNLKKKFKRKDNKKAKNYNMHYGSFALQALENNNITLKQVESFKKTVKDELNKDVKFLCIKLNINHPLTNKKKNSRMGKGKGEIQYYVSKIKKGQILYEIYNISCKKARLAFFKASKKLPVKTRFITR